MRKILPLAFLALALSACGSKDRGPANNPPPPPKRDTTYQVDVSKFPNEAGTPFGRWITTDAETADPQLQYQYLLFVNRQNEIAIGVSCVVEGVGAEGAVMARTRIEGNKLFLLDPVQFTARSADGRTGCTVDLPAQELEWSYRVDELTLVNERRFSRFTFTRR